MELNIVAGQMVDHIFAENGRIGVSIQGEFSGGITLRNETSDEVVYDSDSADTPFMIGAKRDEEFSIMASEKMTGTAIITLANVIQPNIRNYLPEGS